MNAVYSLQSIVPQVPMTLRGADPAKENPQEEFIKLMVAQLQNQDPDKPLDGTALVTQLTQMNAAIAMQRMSYLQTENHAVATAAAVLGKQVQVLDPDTGAKILGAVDRVDYSGAKPQVVVAGQNFPLDAVIRVDR